MNSQFPYPCKCNHDYLAHFSTVEKKNDRFINGPRLHCLASSCKCRKFKP